MHIPHTVLHTFPLELTGVNCLTIRGFFSWRSFPLYSRPLALESHEWPRQNFSLQQQYNIKQASDEKEEKFKLGDCKLIQ